MRISACRDAFTPSTRLVSIKTRSWVVSLSILRPFGPRRATVMLRAGIRRHQRHAEFLSLIQRAHHRADPAVLVPASARAAVVAAALRRHGPVPQFISGPGPELRRPRLLDPARVLFTERFDERRAGARRGPVDVDVERKYRKGSRRLRRCEGFVGFRAVRGSPSYLYRRSFVSRKSQRPRASPRVGLFSRRTSSPRTRFTVRPCVFANRCGRAQITSRTG